MEKSEFLDKNFRAIVSSRNMEEFKAVFEKCKINAIVKNSNNMNALSFPNLNTEQIQYLIDNGININGDCGNGLPAVAHLANNVENLKCLIQNGADIDLKISFYPGSAMEYAQSRHYITHIGNLIDCGANADKIDLEETLYYVNNIDIVALLKITKYKLKQGVKITDKMKKLMYQIGEKFEYYRNDFNKESVDEFSNALEELYKIYDVLPAPRRKVHDGKSDIVVESTTWQKQHAELWDLLVPASGPANTVQGEVIRIVGKVLYEILDNGGINWDNEFKKLVLAIPKYLNMSDNFDKELIVEASKIAKNVSYKSKEKDLERLNEIIVNWVIANPKPIKLEKVEYDR